MGISVDNLQINDAVVYDAEVAATSAINWNTGNRQKFTTSGDVAFTFTNPAGPTNCQLKLSYGGAHTPTFPTIKWAGGTEPTWTKTSGKTDIVTLYFDGTAWWGSAVLNFTT
jgi:hypothetical protein